MNDLYRYQQLLRATMDLLDYHGIREHMTCSLPCIYCIKNDNSLNNGRKCDGRFEWKYEKAIRTIIDKPAVDTLNLSEGAMAELKKIID